MHGSILINQKMGNKLQKSSSIFSIKKYEYFLVAIWGSILFIPFIGLVHLFDWDEINFAEAAREMLVSGNYTQVQINFQPFWEKPPLFFWLQALSMKVFGVNEFASRFPNTIVGISALLFAYHVAKKYFNRSLAWIWVLCITGSFTPHLYYKSGIIDPLFNLFITAAIYQLFLISTSVETSIKNKSSALLGLFIGLAILTKGPVALLVVLLCFFVFLISNKFQLFFTFYNVIICGITTFLVSSILFVFEIFKNDSTFISDFIHYQINLFLNPVAGHGQPFWYHPLVLLLGCFPVSVFALNILFKRKFSNTNLEQLLFFKWMQILFWVVLILFSIVETKIVHYSSLCYLPLTFIAAYAIHEYFYSDKSFEKWKIIFIFSIGLVLSFLLTAVSLVDVFKNKFVHLIDDEFARACLSTNANWTGFEFMFGLSFFGVLVLSTFYLWRNEKIKGVLILLVFISVFIPLFIRFVVPKIEQYSQGPAIKMYIEIAKNNADVEVLGFKSYAQYFYSESKCASNTSDSLTNEKAHFIMMHVGDSKDHLQFKFTEIKQEGGFLLLLKNTERIEEKK